MLPRFGTGLVIAGVIIGKGSLVVTIIGGGAVDITISAVVISAFYFFGFCLYLLVQQFAREYVGGWADLYRVFLALSFNFHVSCNSHASQYPGGGRSLSYCFLVFKFLSRV